MDMRLKTNQEILQENSNTKELDQLKLWNKCNPELQINEKGKMINGNTVA